MVKAIFQRIRDIPRWEVRRDLIAGCLRTAGGDSSIQRILVVERDLVRSGRLSPREYARLMGLGEDYVLPANAIEVYNLLGDGVVAPVVRHPAEHVLEPILQASGVGLRLAAE